MSSSKEPTFEESLSSVEQSLTQLKARYAQVQTDQQRQIELKAQYSELKAQTGKSKALRAELQKIEQQLEELEINLESQLFSWSGLKEVFWQAVRFGGLGIAIGWSLAFYTIKHPTPAPQTAQPAPDTRVSP